MRTINISNQRKRNAQVGFEFNAPRPTIKFKHRGGMDYSNCRLLKAATTLKSLVDAHGYDLTDTILNSDAEVDMERVGMRLGKVKKVFIGPDGKVACRINRRLISYDNQGNERGDKKFQTPQANINGERPLQWTGKLIPKATACRKFVFSHKYQLRHVNGLTYDFLYEMARELHEADSVLLLGAGTKLAGPVVMANGGSPYRAFLEGRVNENGYILILHLTNLEIKPIV